jgi:hypothetical protein
MRQTKDTKKFPKTFLKTKLKTKETTYTLVFGRRPSWVFPKPLNLDIIFSVFGRFIEDYIRILTFWEKSKNRFGLSAPKLTKNRSLLIREKRAFNVLHKNSWKLS